MMRRRLSVVFLCIWLAGDAAFALQPPKPADEYQPVADNAIVTEQLPAAPLLVAAYAFILVAVVFYLWTIWRRLGRVEADMRTLEQRLRSSTR